MRRDHGLVSIVILRALRVGLLRVDQGVRVNPSQVITHQEWSAVGGAAVKDQVKTPLRPFRNVKLLS